MSEQSPRMAWTFPSREDDPWWDAFNDFVRAVDGSGFAHREDRSIIWSGGGTISWDVTTATFAWTGTINIYSPMSAKLMQIEAGSIGGALDPWADGEVVYVNLTRLALVNVAKSLVKANALPSDDDAMAFGVRIGDTIYLRTGISLGDGDTAEGVAPVPGGGSALEVEDEGVSVDPDVSVMDFVGAGVTATQTAPGEVEINIPGGAADKYTAKFIVGNGPAGDTLAECHFLDPGDGSGIVAAIAAAQSAGYPYPDVYVRPGTYNLGLGGPPPTGMITIPSGIRVRGAGRQCVQVITADGTLGSNPHAFRLQEDAELFDVKVLAIPPADFAQTSTPSIVTVDSIGHVERVEVEFEDYWNFILEPYFANTFAAFSCLGMGSGTRARFVECFAKKVPYSGALSFLPWGFDIGGDILDRCYVEGGGDTCIGVAAGGIVSKCIIENDVTPYVICIDVSFGAGAQIVANKIVAQFAGGNGSKGIRLIGADSCTVQGNELEATMGSAGADAIEVAQSDDCSVVGNVGRGFVDAISLNAFADDNVVGFNNFAGALYTDLGVGNDLAHNK